MQESLLVSKVVENYVISL